MYVLNNKTWKRNNKHKTTEKYKKYNSTKSQHEKPFNFYSSYSLLLHLKRYLLII